MKTRKPSLVLTIILVLFISSCATDWHVAIPVTPSLPLAARNYSDAQGFVADSLQPTFEWKPLDLNAKQYDFIIYKAFIVNSLQTRGKEAYYKEGIEGTKYRIEQSLEPNTFYVWGVRIRNGSEVGPWSTYDFRKGLIPVKGFASAWVSNYWFSFRTPSK